jgi:hypothetical protein
MAGMRPCQHAKSLASSQEARLFDVFNALKGLILKLNCCPAFAPLCLAPPNEGGLLLIACLAPAQGEIMKTQNIKIWHNETTGESRAGESRDWLSP